MAEGVRPLGSSLTLLVVVAVPGEVSGVGAEGGLGCEGERVFVEIGELEVGAAGEDGFGDIGLGDLDAQVVVDRPEACVEEIVGAGRKRVRLLGSSLTPSATGWLKGPDDYVVA